MPTVRPRRDGATMCPADTMRGMRRMHLMLIATAGAAAAATLTACEQPLFPANAPRSQYERFTYQRGGYTLLPGETEDFGVSVQELRTRLRPFEGK